MKPRTRELLSLSAAAPSTSLSEIGSSVASAAVMRLEAGGGIDGDGHASCRCRRTRKSGIGSGSVRSFISPRVSPISQARET